MLWLALHELRARRLASLLTIAGVFVATFGFVLLAVSSKSTEAELTGTISSAWGGPYQLLVRPPGSATALEVQAGLVRPNYLGGIGGGIDRDQLARIRRIPGVEVAAPLSVLGYVQWPAGKQLDLRELTTGRALDVFRISTSAVAEAGLSSFDLGVRYVLYAPDGKIDESFRTMTVGDLRLVCDSARGIECRTGPPEVLVSFAMPLLIAGIDPSAEAGLVGLDDCVQEGRYLGPADVPGLVAIGSSRQPQPVLPIMVSARSFIDERLLVRVDRAQDPTLILGGLTAREHPGAWDAGPTIEVPAQDAYDAFIDSIAYRPMYNASPLWVVRDVSYEQLGRDHLAVQSVAPDYAVFDNPLLTSLGGPAVSPVLPEARDVWFRQVVARTPVRRQELPNGWTVVGQYDPACVAGFPGLAGGFLESYALPGVELPDGQILGPTRSVAGYVNPPPVLLTTLETAGWLADPARFTGAPGASFISSIRVRVRGVESPGPEAEGRLSSIAGQIHEATGLHVDILVGSSPRQISVDLLEGRFGRPALTVREGWAVKGIAFRFYEAVTAQNLALFSLILVAATALVGQTTHVAVRRRRREFAVLRALGWPAHRIWQLVLLEVGVLGLLAGLLALGLGIPAAGAFGVSTTWWQPLLAIPIALLVALGGATLAAVSATRQRPLRALVGEATTRSSRPPSTVIGLALREIARGWRIDALLAAASLALGATLTGGVVMVAASFDQRLDLTLLGAHLSAEVRPFHVVVVLLALLLSALSAGVLTTLSYFERQRQLAALRALGWPQGSVVAYLMAGILVSIVVASLLAALLVAGLGWLLHASLSAIAAGAGAAVLGAAGSGLIGAAGPLLIAYRLRAAQMLTDH